VIRMKKRIIAEIPVFNLYLPHLRSEFEALRKIGSYIISDKNIYRWTFPITAIKEVQIALNGSIVEYDKTFLEKFIIPHCDPLMQELEVGLNSKGKGEYVLTVIPEGYLVTWYERGKAVHATVARDYVELIWNEVICTVNKGEMPDNNLTARDLLEEKRAIRGSKVAEKIMKILERHHWDINTYFLDEKNGETVTKFVNQGKWNHERSGKFNWNYFLGHRKYHKNMYLYPLRVLKAMGLLEHTHNGVVIRLSDKDEFEVQARFTEKHLMEEEMERETRTINTHMEDRTAENIDTWDFDKRKKQGKLF